MTRLHLPKGLRVPAILVGALAVVLLVRGGVNLLGQISGPAAPVICVDGVPTCSASYEVTQYACAPAGDLDSGQYVQLSEIICVDGVPTCPQGGVYQAVCTAGTPPISGEQCTALCGDTLVDAPEECDDGNMVNGDGCDDACKEEVACNSTAQCPPGNECDGDFCVPLCGNGDIDEGETCDDGDTLDGDGCSSQCQEEPFHECGNTILEFSEQCDDGNTANGDGCDDECSLDRPELCGNSAINPGETCDDGNHIAADGCGPTCQLEPPCDGDEDCPFPFLCQNDFCALQCGNDQFQPDLGEQCDDGNLINGDGCSDVCLLDNPELCPNTVVDPGEECDDGNALADDGCGPTCQDEDACNSDDDCPFGFVCGEDYCVYACGNGSVEPQLGEQCDDANTINGDGCSDLCLLDDAELCGNNAINPGEECDDGNRESGDGCGPFCQYEDPCVNQGDCSDGYVCEDDLCQLACGNGTVQHDLGEQCDDGNVVPGDGCSDFCKLEGSLCGNTVLEPQEGEQCDDGNTIWDDGCDGECQLENPQLCGNTIVNPGEQCDDGNVVPGDGCDQHCQRDLDHCGNNLIEPEFDEQCDDGNLNASDGCGITCKLDDPELCGNTIENPGETCDDGNRISGDGCNEFCQDEELLCGNASVEPGEQCDQYPSDRPRTCSYECTNCENPPSCPAAPANCHYVYEEEDIGPNGCPLTCGAILCVDPTPCGNTVYEPAIGEECEDGNKVNGDGCSSTCTLENPALCGNNVQNPGEECDDGNTEAADGCDATCQIEPPCGPANSCPSPLVCENSFCTYLCGNGSLDGIEQCDDGNVQNGDGCSSICIFTDPPGNNNLCGNGVTEQQLGEQCDDGNTSNEDECNNACEIICTLDAECPSGQCTEGVCESACGNGDYEPELGEQCDDGNQNNADDCNNACVIICVNNTECPSDVCVEGLCTYTCGNGEFEPEYGEQCDDGNVNNTDSCTTGCLLTPPPQCEVNSDCENGAACVGGFCVLPPGGECDLPSDCQSNLCLSGECAMCTSDSQCPSGICLNGACALDNNQDCSLPSQCQSNLCLNGDCASCTSDAQCPNGNCVNGACQLDTNQGCTNDAQCLTGLCLSGQCSACTSTSQCNAGEVCSNGTCLISGCGNGDLDIGEQCDDGNKINNDGCSASCMRECDLHECADGGQAFCQVTNGRQCNQLTSGQCFECVGPPQYDCLGNECSFPEAQSICGEMGLTCKNAPETATCIQCVAQSLYPAAAECPADGCAIQGAKEFCSAVGRTCETAPLNGQCFRCSDGPLQCAGNECTKGGDDFCTGLGNFCKTDRTSDICISCVPPPTEPPVCGNAIREPGEQCDDGNTDNGDTCSSSCRRTNGQECATPDQCDSGVCSKSGICEPCGDSDDTLCGLHQLCVHGACAELCGNGKVDTGEQCDSGPGGDSRCTSDCKLELNQQCLEDGECGTNRCVNGACQLCNSNLQCSSRSCVNGACANLCGDGAVQRGEACDQGRLNGVAGACSAECLLGNGLACRRDGECGSGLCQNGQCSACTAANQCRSNICVNNRCAHFCGDGTLNEGEQCDDGNRLSADGCNRYCERESLSEVAADLVRGGLVDPSSLTQPFHGGADELERRLREENDIRNAAQGLGPAGSTGPAAIAVMAGGAAAGWAWMRRRRRP